MARSSVLQRLRVASPCPASWEKMRGDELVRFCDQCKLSVYNVSAMSAAAAEKLLLEREGRLCVRYFQRADGTILTRDCPVGLRLVRQKLARLVGGLAAAFAFVFGGLAALGRGPQGSQHMRLRFFQPFAKITEWLTPAPVPSAAAGGSGNGNWTVGRVSYSYYAPEELTPEQNDEINADAREMMLRDPASYSAEDAQFLARFLWSWEHKGVIRK